MKNISSMFALCTIGRSHVHTRKWRKNSVNGEHG